MEDIFIEKMIDSVTYSDLIHIVLKNEVVYTIINTQVDLKLNDEDYAELLGISVSVLDKWKSGDYDFSISDIANICEKLKVVATLSIVPLED